jgi:hypothetical protein
MNSTKTDPAGVQPVGNDLVLARSRKMQLIHEELARARMHEQREQVQREALASRLLSAKRWQRRAEHAARRARMAREAL